MNNTYTKADTPAISGADSRAVETVTNLESLNTTGAPFQRNPVKIDDEWEFDSPQKLLELGWIRRQVTRVGGNNKTTIICGERTRAGVTKLAWFNLGQLSRTDINDNPMMPEWYDLPNDNAKIAKLHSMGKFKITDSRTIPVQKWDGAVRLEGETENVTYPVIPWM